MADYAARSQAGSKTAQQIYVTHCLKEHSYLNKAGFSVRASSTDDPGLLKFALDYPAYELPVDMWSRSPQPYQTPRRLALVAAPPGTRGPRVALVHSSYLTHDTMNRAGNFLTHVLIYEAGALTLREALRSWGSTDWRTDTVDESVPKQIEPFPGVPEGPFINDGALTRFLRDEPLGGPQSLDTAIYPDPAKADARRRRDWLRVSLQACHAALAPGSARGRFFLLAEPGLVALLLYGVARLLPEDLVGTLPFSTYEPGHTSFRESELARVVGTYNEDPLRALEADYLTRRGYGLDTTRNKSSDFPQTPPLFDALLDVAADPDRWSEIDQIRELWALDNRVRATAWMDPYTLDDARTVRPSFAKLKSGHRLEKDELIEFQKNKLSDQLLHSGTYRAGIWETIRDHWFEKEILSGFPHLIKDHLDDLRSNTRALAYRNPVREWLERWRVLKGLLNELERGPEFTSLLQAFQQNGAQGPISFEERIDLLREWQEVGRGKELPAEFVWLLAARTGDEFSGLASAGVAPRQLVAAARLALEDPRFPPGDDLLGRLPDASLAGFLRAVLESEDSVVLLPRLLHPKGASAPPNYDRMIFGPLRADPATLDSFLVAIGADRLEWLPYWRDRDRLAEILHTLLPEHKQFADRFWEGYQPQLDWRVLTGDREQVALWGLPDRVHERVGARIPHVWAQKLADRKRLQTHLTNPPGGTPAELKTACHNILEKGDPPLAFLKRYLAAEQGRHPDDFPDWLRTFAKTIRGFHTEDRPALGDWLTIVDECLHESRREMAQLAFFEGAVPRTKWYALAFPFRRRLARHVFESISEKRIWPKIEAQIKKWGPIAAGIAATLFVVIGTFHWYANRKPTVIAKNDAKPRSGTPVKVATLTPDDLEITEPNALTPKSRRDRADPKKGPEPQKEPRKEEPSGSPHAEFGRHLDTKPPVEDSNGKEKPTATAAPKKDENPVQKRGPADNPATPAPIQVASNSTPATQSKMPGVKSPKDGHRAQPIRPDAPTQQTVLDMPDSFDYPIDIKSNKPTLKTEVNEIAAFSTPRGIALAVRTRLQLKSKGAGKVLQGGKVSAYIFTPDGSPPWVNEIDEYRLTKYTRAISSSGNGDMIGLIDIDDNTISIYDFNKNNKDKINTKDENLNWFSHRTRLSNPDGKDINENHIIINEKITPVLTLGSSHLAVLGCKEGGALVAVDFTEPGKTRRALIAQDEKPAALVLDSQETRLAMIIPETPTLFLKYINNNLITVPAQRFSMLRHPGVVLAVAFQPESGALVTSFIESAGGDKPNSTVWLWPSVSPEVFWKYSEEERLRDSERYSHQLPNLYSYKEGVILSLAFSPRGKYLALGTSDGNVVIYGMKERQEHLRLPFAVTANGHYNNHCQVTKIAFSPDGRFLAALNGDEGTVRVWVTKGWDDPPPKSGK